MRTLAVILATLVLLIQYPLWIGKGGWVRVWETDRQLSLHRQKNAQLQARNQALEADVRDLKQGFEAIEERARYELGLVKPDEVFFQFVDAQAATARKP